MKITCPSCVSLEVIENDDGFDFVAQGEEKSGENFIDASMSYDDGIATCHHCDESITIRNDIIDELPDKILNEQEIDELAELDGVYAVNEQMHVKTYFPPKTAYSFFGLFDYADHEYVYAQTLNVSFLKESVTYAYVKVEQSDAEDRTIYEPGPGWEEIDRMPLQWRRDPRKEYKNDSGLGIISEGTLGTDTPV